MIKRKLMISPEHDCLNCVAVSGYRAILYSNSCISDLPATNKPYLPAVDELNFKLPVMFSLYWPRQDNRWEYLPIQSRGPIPHK